jgi:DnaJ homolog subfamily A member 2
MGGMDPESLFSQLFGSGGGFFGSGGPRARGPKKGKDLVHRVKVTLEDLYKGKTTKLSLQKHVICTKCNGKGGKEGSVKTCGTCRGTGIRVVMRQLGPMVQQLQQTCTDCSGEGQVIPPKDRCKGCAGKKTTQEKKILEVHVDKGMKDGQTITFAGEADQAPGTIPGDVVIVIDEKPHETFKRNGDDLICDVKLDLLTALTGGQFTIAHLDERVLLVDIPSDGTVIAPGECLVYQQRSSSLYSFLDIKGPSKSLKVKGCLLIATTNLEISSSTFPSHFRNQSRSRLYLFWRKPFHPVRLSTNSRPLFT